MRQAHRAGEKLLVDVAGRTAGVIDGLTGQIGGGSYCLRFVADDMAVRYLGVASRSRCPQRFVPAWCPLVKAGCHAP